MKRFSLALAAALVACGSTRIVEVDRLTSRLDDDAGSSCTPGVDAADASVDASADASADVEAAQEAETEAAPLPPGVLFFDDFTGALGPEWTALDRHTDYSNQEIGCYRPANVLTAAGNLSIETRVESSSCGDATHLPSAEQYTSGAVIWSSFAFGLGTIEVRAKLAGGTGPWPAIWLHGTNCQGTFASTADDIGACHWPQPGSDEIDIVDAFGDRTHPNQAIRSTVANGTCPNVSISDMSANWHVYALTRTASSLTFKIDGATTCQLGAGQFPTGPQFLILNASMRSVVDSTLPQTTLIDYVKVTDGTDGGVAPPPEPQPEAGPEPIAEAGPDVVDAGADIVDAGSDIVDAAAEAEAEASSPRVLVGESTQWTVADSIGSGAIEAFKSTATTTGAATRLLIYLTVSGRATKLGLYTHNAGSNQPQTLLASGAFTSVSGWNTVTIPATAVTSGATYWLAVLATNGTLSFVEKSETTGLGSVSVGSGLSALPATWSASGQLRWASSGMSAYARE